jgi:gamma-glutamyl phosphate reductase
MKTFSSFLSKLNPFSQKRTELSEKHSTQIELLITQYPDLWEALKEVSYMMMNREVRKMIKAPNKDLIAARVEAIDDFIKECLTIKGKKYDNIVDQSGHLPVLEGKMGSIRENAAPNPIDMQADAKPRVLKLLDYIMSNDVRTRDGKIRTTIDR